MTAAQIEIPTYTGLPMVYLDQNILDAGLKGRLSVFFEKLKKDYQVVYSDETLNEIRRAGIRADDYAHQFLDLLTELGAAHIKIKVNDDFSTTEQLLITNTNPFGVYEEYCSGDKIYEDVLASMMLLPFKIFGGGIGVSFDEIKAQELSVFRNLMDYLDSLADEIIDENPVLAAAIKSQKESSISQFENVMDNLFSQMRKNIPDDENWSGLRDFRDAINLEPFHFNNIEKPKVLEQIWSKVNSVASINKENFSLERFFGLVNNPIYPDRPFFRHEKVMAIYSHLNMIGYFPDKPLHKDRGFVRANSDLRHASIASLTQFIVSGDGRFIKKVEAAYEFLGVSTGVHYIDAS